MIDFESLLMTELGLLFPLVPAEDIRKLKRGSFPWDSFRHIELISQIEMKFHVDLTVEDALRAEDFSTLLTVIRDRAAAARKT